LDKSEIRRAALSARRALSPGQCAEYSRRIHEHLKSYPPFNAAQCVLTYINSKDNEVETQSLIVEMLNRGKCVLVPRCAKPAILEWCKISTLNDLEPNNFGILDAKAELPAAAPPADSICLVPGIAFRKDGHRIGYGGGYYDRFLKNYNGLSIGLAYETQLLYDWIPDEHDIPVIYIVTEKVLMESRNQK